MADVSRPLVLDLHESLEVFKFLQNEMSTSALRLVGPDFVFQQENAPVHTEKDDIISAVNKTHSYHGEMCNFEEIRRVLRTTAGFRRT